VLPLQNYVIPLSQRGRYQWPRGLRRRSAAARLLSLWVRIPPESWLSVCCDCCVLSGIEVSSTRLENSYRLWWVVVCGLETSWVRRPWPTAVCCVKIHKLSQRDSQHTPRRLEIDLNGLITEVSLLTYLVSALIT